MLDHSVTYNPITILELKLKEWNDIVLFPTMLERDWVNYPGDHVQTFYDVELEDGTILYAIWPNANKWDGRSKDEIKRVRFSRRLPAFTDDEDDIEIEEIVR